MYMTFQPETEGFDFVVSSVLTSASLEPDDKLDSSEDTLRSYCRTWSARLSNGTSPKIWFISQVGEVWFTQTIHNKIPNFWSA